MGIYNPLYNEETGWTPLDQLQPWQQTLMNPSAGGTGYNTSPMQMDLVGQFNNMYQQSLPQPVQNYSQPTNPFLSQGSANNIYGAGNMNGTSQPSNNAVIGSPQLATNMGMTGAQNVGGVGMYTGANEPLNMNLFAPNGVDAAMLQGSMGGFGQELFKAAQANGLNPNTSYLGFIDDLSRRALAAKGGGGGLLPQDFVNYMQSQAGQQWFNGMRTPQQQAPGTPPIQQTGPQNPPVAPLPQQPPPSQVSQPYSTPQQNPYMTPQQIQQFTGMMGFNPSQIINSGLQQYGNSQMQNRLNGLDQAMLQARNNGQQFDYTQWSQQNSSNPQQMGLQVDPQRSDFLIDPRTGNRYTRSGTTMITPQEWAQMNSQSQQQLQPYNTQMAVDPAQGNPNTLEYRARQFSDDPRTQQAYINEMLGIGQLPQQYQYPAYGQSGNQPVDYRAATFGGGQTQNPQQTATPQTSPVLGTPTTVQNAASGGMWGGATNRRGGFGGQSLFGGYGGQPTNTYSRPGGTGYGRAASYGQTQRPIY